MYAAYISFYTSFHCLPMMKLTHQNMADFSLFVLCFKTSRYLLSVFVFYYVLYNSFNTFLDCLKYMVSFIYYMHISACMYPFYVYITSICMYWFSYKCIWNTHLYIWLYCGLYFTTNYRNFITVAFLVSSLSQCK